ncbi:MAG: ribonuclease HII [Patescibacteria group bacterium]
MYIIGIDEAGRGPLAGPVGVGVVLIPKGLRLKNPHTKFPLRDSKKLPAHAREGWFRYLKKHPNIFYKVAMVHPKTIDRINITEAVNLAATRALEKVYKLISYKLIRTIYIDAGIKIPEKNLQTYKLRNLKTLIRGDEKINAIKLASIAAKVTRDRYMTKKHKEYPQYEFHLHKGYGTKVHREAVKKFGPCPLHRLTFIRKYTTI